MANQKRYTVAYNPPAPGSEPVIAIQRNSDGFFWEDGVGFAAPLVDNAMTEGFFGFWVYETDFEVWDNGLYNVLIRANGGDPLVGYSETVSGDRQIGFIEASSITSQNAATPINQSIKDLISTVAGMGKKIGVLESKVDSFGIQLLRGK